MDGSRLVVHNLNVKKTLLQALFDLFMCGNFHKTHTYYLLCVRVCGHVATLTNALRLLTF